MTTTGEAIFWQDARSVSRDIGMERLDPAHGAAVDAVRWCMLVRGRPTHHRQRFLETEAPAILAYLEALASKNQAEGWRTLEERVRLRAEILQEPGMQPCARPWLAAIWHALPAMAAIGQAILDRLAENVETAPVIVPTAADTGTGAGGDGDKGSSGKAGSATANMPNSPSRLALPIGPVTLTPAEEKALDLGNGADDLKKIDDLTPDDPYGSDDPAGPKPPGRLK